MQYPKKDKGKLKLEHKFTPTDRRLEAIYTYELEGEVVQFKDKEKRIYTYLYRQFHGGKLSYAYPSLEYLQEVLAIPMSTLKRSIRALIACGLIIRETVNRKNRYWLRDLDVLVEPKTYNGYDPFSEEYSSKMSLSIGKYVSFEEEDDSDGEYCDLEQPF